MTNTDDATLFVCPRCGPRIAAYVEVTSVRCGCGKRCKRVRMTKGDASAVMRGDVKYEEVTK